jgi:hypothetical protein
VEAKVPEFRELGQGDVEERLAAVVRESEVVIEKLRARLDEMREGKATHLTLDEVIDLVKELNELWDVTYRVPRRHVKNPVLGDLRLLQPPGPALHKTCG